jgi:hypothetical protein
MDAFWYGISTKLGTTEQPAIAEKPNRDRPIPVELIARAETSLPTDVPSNAHARVAHRLPFRKPLQDQICPKEVLQPIPKTLV